MKYRLSIEGLNATIIECASIEDAREEAEDWVRDGEWFSSDEQQPKTVHVRIQSFDDRKDQWAYPEIIEVTI